MSNYTLQERVQFTEYVMNQVNKIWIKQRGGVYNCREFWDTIPHSFHNEDWLILLDVMELIRLDDPSCYIPYAYDVFQDARRILQLEGHAGNPRALDRLKNRKTAYKTLMFAKDCWNNWTGYELPTKFPPEPEPPTQFEKLFNPE